jgi:hypothetical protein
LDWIKLLARIGQAPPAAMADMKDNHDVSIDRKEHSISMGLGAVKELAHLKRKLRIFRR